MSSSNNKNNKRKNASSTAPSAKRARHNKGSSSNNNNNNGDGDENESKTLATEELFRSLSGRVLPPCDASMTEALTVGSGDMAQLGLGEMRRERKKPTVVKAEAVVGQNPVVVAAGALHCAVVTRDGRVVTWGCNDDNALGHTEDEWIPTGVKGDLEGKTVIDVKCGDCHSVALSDDGLVYSWGMYKDMNGAIGHSKVAKKQVEPALVEELAKYRVVGIACGENEDVAVTDAGHVFEWGDVRLGKRSSRRSQAKLQKLHPQRIRFAYYEADKNGKKRKRNARIARVFATGCTKFALATNGMVFAWGLNNHGQMGIGERSASPIQLPIRVHSFERLGHAHGGVQQIAGGIHHTLILTNDGTVFSCGRGDYGRLGHGNQESIVEPREIVGLRALVGQGHRVVQVASGEGHCFAVSDDGRLFAWGFGDTLALGNGIEQDELSPVQITSKQLTDLRRHVLAVDGGSQHSIILASGPGADN